jgi:hypothetical protein
MPRGGYRLGAGRKISGVSKKSKSIRVSEQNAYYVDNIDSLLQLIKEWELAAAAGGENSPRWTKTRQLLHELRQLFPDSADSQ